MIFFVGMPGAGKSYWGSSVATAYQLKFTDLDSYIEDKLGMAIADYFERFGEEEFRKREQEALAELIDRADSKCIIACGGGTAAYGDNMQRMKRAGCTVYLKAGLEQIMKRLENSATRRPLLEGRDPAMALEDLYEKRVPYFSQADHIFEIEKMSLSNFDKLIEECTNRH